MEQTIVKEGLLRIQDEEQSTSSDECRCTVIEASKGSDRYIQLELKVDRKLIRKNVGAVYRSTHENILCVEGLKQDITFLRTRNREECMEWFSILDSGRPPRRKHRSVPVVPPSSNAAPSRARPTRSCPGTPQAIFEESLRDTRNRSNMTQSPGHVQHVEATPPPYLNVNFSISLPQTRDLYSDHHALQELLYEVVDQRPTSNNSADAGHGFQHEGGAIAPENVHGHYYSPPYEPHCSNGNEGEDIYATADDLRDIKSARDLTFPQSQDHGQPGHGGACLCNNALQKSVLPCMDIPSLSTGHMQTKDLQPPAPPIKPHQIQVTADALQHVKLTNVNKQVSGIQSDKAQRIPPQTTAKRQNKQRPPPVKAKPCKAPQHATPGANLDIDSAHASRGDEVRQTRELPGETSKKGGPGQNPADGAFVSSGTTTEDPNQINVEREQPLYGNLPFKTPVTSATTPRTENRQPPISAKPAKAVKQLSRTAQATSIHPSGGRDPPQADVNIDFGCDGDASYNRTIRGEKSCSTATYHHDQENDDPLYGNVTNITQQGPTLSPSVKTGESRTCQDSTAFRQQPRQQGPPVKRIPPEVKDKPAKLKPNRPPQLSLDASRADKLVDDSSGKPFLPLRSREPDGGRNGEGSSQQTKPTMCVPPTPHPKHKAKGPPRLQIPAPNHTNMVPEPEAKCVPQNRRQELDVWIPKNLCGIGSVVLIDQGHAVIVQSTHLTEYLTEGDQVLQIGDIDVKNKGKDFATICLNSVNANEVHLKVLR